MSESTQWELDVRPRRARIVAITVAVVLFTAFAVPAAMMRSEETGVFFDHSDQLAMVLLGAVFAGVALLFTRPRIRVGREGALVRNIVSTQLVRWSDMRGVSFPDRATWARIDLPNDEYVAVMAISATDRHRAADAIEQFRALGVKYGNS